MSVVLEFAKAMGEELYNNRHKTSWNDLTPRWLLHRLRQETKELEKLIRQREQGKKVKASDIRSEAADIANFAMMIADVCDGLDSRLVEEEQAEGG